VTPGEWLGAFVVAAVSVVPFACSSPPKLSGPGGSCLTTLDCQLGLECLLGGGPNATSVCSSDLSSLVPPATGGGLADAAADGDAAVQIDGMVQDAPPAADAGQPPAETGVAQEAAPPMDSGAPDAGREAAPSPQDSGSADAPAG
jgi:hypothetical protein